MLFFIALIILLILLGFLFRALIDVLRPDPIDGTEDDPALIEEDATVTLPDYFNLERDQAIALIASEGLEPVVTSEPNSDVADGRVFRQNPVAGAIVAEGTQIEITVSQADGQVEVPNLVSLSQEDAIRRLNVLGFTPDIQEVDNEIFGAGEVLSQNPLMGELAERGSVVMIEVSLGPSERQIPDLSGVEFSEALGLLFELDFRTTRVDESDPQVAEGLVLRTEPEAGSLLRAREIVTIFVSTGVEQIPVPSVEGLLVDSARQTLIASGFEVIEDRIEVENPDDINTVVAQTPPANIELSEGDAVTIVIGIAPEEGDGGPAPGDDDGGNGGNGGGDGDGGGDDGGGDDDTTTTTEPPTDTTEPPAPDPGDGADAGDG